MQALVLGELPMSYHPPEDDQQELYWMISKASVCTERGGVKNAEECRRILADCLRRATRWAKELKRNPQK